MAVDPTRITQDVTTHLADLDAKITALTTQRDDLNAKTVKVQNALFKLDKLRENARAYLASLQQGA